MFLARLPIPQNQVLFIHSWTDSLPGTHISLVLTSVLQPQAELMLKDQFIAEGRFVLNLII